ncbi:hypothetical protein WN51_10464 [Melipona quadrifasciata]|uniref:Uncharacterized protein n=1 Tax=Melipona quadrifasciata TaxID=166423 RepID=A0A0M9A4H6_9HYME|nr:hypothetical protein WN51_10464 [Melipona quadrifasciata]
MDFYVILVVVRCWMFLVKRTQDSIGSKVGSFSGKDLKLNWIKVLHKRGDIGRQKSENGTKENLLRGRDMQRGGTERVEGEKGWFLHMKIPLYHVVPFALDRSKTKKKKQRQKKKKKKKKEKETDRGRDSLSDSRILPRFPGNDDTDGTDHWEELLRADSARVRYHNIPPEERVKTNLSTVKQNNRFLSSYIIILTIFCIYKDEENENHELPTNAKKLKMLEYSPFLNQVVPTALITCENQHLSNEPTTLRMNKLTFSNPLRLAERPTFDDSEYSKAPLRNCDSSNIADFSKNLPCPSKFVRSKENKIKFENLPNVQLNEFGRFWVDFRVAEKVKKQGRAQLEIEMLAGVACWNLAQCERIVYPENSKSHFSERIELAIRLVKTHMSIYIEPKRHANK